MRIVLALILTLFSAGALNAQTCIPAGSKVFIEEMPQDFHTYITSALMDTKTPLSIVTDRDKADFLMTGTASESKRNSWARVIFAGQTGSKESASVTLVNLHTDTVVYSVASDRSNARRGKRSVAQKIAREIRGRVKESVKSGCTL